jgi:hypothetical protein
LKARQSLMQIGCPEVVDDDQQVDGGLAGGVTTRSGSSSSAITVSMPILVRIGLHLPSPVDHHVAHRSALPCDLLKGRVGVLPRNSSSCQVTSYRAQIDSRWNADRNESAVEAFVVTSGGEQVRKYASGIAGVLENHPNESVARRNHNPNEFEDAVSIGDGGLDDIIVRDAVREPGEVVEPEQVGVDVLGPRSLDLAIGPAKAHLQPIIGT